MLRLREERERLGLSRAELARRASVNESNYGMVENERRVPYRPEIERIAAALCWPGDPDALLEDVGGDD